MRSCILNQSPIPQPGPGLVRARLLPLEPPQLGYYYLLMPTRHQALIAHKFP